MKIAGKEIKKGQTKTVKLAVAKLTSGTEIDIPVVVSCGTSDGPVLLLMAGLHGAENINPSKTFHNRKWLRAPVSGFFHPTIKAGDKVKFKQTLASICRPLGDYHKSCNCPKNGYIITLNNNPVVNRKDTIRQVAYDA